MVFSSLWKYPLALALAFLAVVIVTGGIMLGKRLLHLDQQKASLPPALLGAAIGPATSKTSGENERKY
jgi:hypothetical protein